MKCSYCEKDVQEGLTVCDSCGAELSVADSGTETYEKVAVDSQKLGMKWYKFLIYFMFFANAISYLVEATMYFLGDKADFLSKFVEVDSFSGNFRFIGIIYGFILIAMSASALYVRNGLAKFKASSPLIYIIWDVVISVIMLVFSLLSQILAGEAVFGDCLIEALSTAFAETFFIIWNTTYFKKRKHLFVN